uniref:L-Fucosyltransferase n=1 Tax=Pelusios castaneus TaxID=367368 RepID=A0A8C8REP7_9SAUR
CGAVNSIGHLGNHKGEYAILYTLGKMNGRPAYILLVMHRKLVPLFHITLTMVSSDVVWNVPWRNCGHHDWMSEYRHIEGKYILQEFSFHNYIEEEANQHLAELHGQRRNMTYVGVQVRGRVDYVRVMPQIWKEVVANKVYLEKAMVYFWAKYQEQVFVVTSNGMENINASQGDVYFSGSRKESSLGRDFALLLARGETIYLANYTSLFPHFSGSSIPKPPSCPSGSGSMLISPLC